jgi:hypothetical protein
MPRPEGTTYRQTTFLRSFRDSLAGPPPDAWPSPAILRRWLRKPAFRRALQSVQSALRLQTDFLVVSTAANAARSLDSPQASPHLANLLRLAHLRQRFPADAPPPEPAPEAGRKNQNKPEPPPYDLVCLSCGKWQFLKKEEFYKIAWKRHCFPPLRHHPDFPPPVPQDTFYYNLLHDPWALLWYLNLYNESTTDKRFSPILVNCQRLIPTEDSDGPLPRFAKPQSTDSTP